MTKPTEPFSHRPSERALFVMGVGCSMFFDGIVLHQLLQWHHLGSSLHLPNTVRNLQWNTLLGRISYATCIFSRLICELIYPLIILSTSFLL